MEPARPKGGNIRLAGQRGGVQRGGQFLQYAALLVALFLLRPWPGPQPKIVYVAAPANVTAAECKPCPKCKSGLGSAAAAGGSSGGVQEGSPTEVLLPPINLAEMLGTADSLTSVSDLAYMSYRCLPPLKESFRGVSEEQESHRIQAVTQKIADLVAEVKGGPVDANKTILDNLGLAGIHDPKFFAVREAISEYLARDAAYLSDKKVTKGMCCDAKDKEITYGQLGKLGGPAGCGVECLGYMTQSRLLMPLGQLAKLAVTHGFCTDPSFYKEGYAREMVKRMADDNFSKGWYNVKTRADDSIIFAFQLLYEHHKVFLRQRWLGAMTMQNPFDTYAITDIINEVKPDLIIEGGTANGGSALLWASMLHLIGKGGRVITIDVTDPKNAYFGDGSSNKENPWENHLWEKYVTFLHGSSMDDAIYSQVKAAVANATRVLVLLDDSHQQQHVIQETEKYCPLATPGSYCITQDTKMGRFNWEGPMLGVETFLKNHPEFSSDRSRELLFTDHPRGYLKRAAAADGSKPA